MANLSADDSPGDITETVIDLSDRCLRAYEVNPSLVKEHFGIEREIAEGGYGRRQIYELVQNGADAALDAGLTSARIAVVLTKDVLYCANEGEPITPDGVSAILGAHISPKRADQIGRFGVGFKSVLAVTDAPEFLGRSGSFRFDPDRARHDITAVVDSERVPRLRLAYPMDTESECDSDSVLDELMGWATTVIRLPLNAEGRAWLHDDLTSFPAQFMLFSGHVGSLQLEDRVQETSRLISASDVDGDIELVEDGKANRWRLFQKEHVLSEAARRTAGELADRETIPLVWAAPLTSTGDRGSFWAFFPTEYWTTLRGIVNAPWKTNADRQNLLASEINSELIVQTAALVTANLASLATEEDPGRYLDYLPGRGREAPQWADEQLTEEVWELSRYADSVPDLDGVFRRPHEVKLHPERLPEAALELFASTVTDRAWAHPRVESRQRRPRVERIMEEAPGRSHDVEAWFEVLVNSDAPGSLSSAVEVAAALRQNDIEGWEDVPFIPTAGGKLVTCDPEVVYLGHDESPSSTDVHVVDHRFAEVPGVREALDALGIRPLDASGQLEALVATRDPSKSETWEGFWPIARQVDPSRVVTLLDEHEIASKVQVLTRAGHWARLLAVLIPGVVVSSDDTVDDGLAVDMVFHAEDQELLDRLGAIREPQAGRSPKIEPWFQRYRREQINRYLNRPELGGRQPYEQYLTFAETGYAGPCAALERLSTKATTLFSQRLLELPEATSAWEMRHSSQSSYGRMACPNPALWMLRQYGSIPTSLGVRPARRAVSPALEFHARTLPVAHVSDEVAEQLDLPAELDQLTRNTWVELLAEVAEAEEPERFGETLALCVSSGTRPIEAVALRHGEELTLRELVVCRPGDDHAPITALGHRFVVVHDDETASALCERWGLKSAADFYTTQVHPIDPAEPVMVADVFPDLVAVDADLSHLQIVVCNEIVVERSTESGAIRTPEDHRLEGSVLYIAAEPNDDRAVLDGLTEAWDLELTDEERERLLASEIDRAGRQLRLDVQAAETVEEKILAAVGRDALVRRLPRQVVQEAERTSPSGIPDVDVARLALAVDGVEVLRHHRDDLVARGLEAPSRWAGGSTARRFVLGLGFPEEFAGFRSESRDALVHVPGPPAMPPLHDFQQAAAANIRRLLAAGQGRGLLSLPTGAGKTRTAVQAIVESIRDGELRGPVLWAAQTDELCEQAVSSWADNWRAVGPRETLKLARLWSSNEAQDLGDPHHVIVATMAKLEIVMTKSSYDWLSRCSAVVVDEAHRATAVSYSRLLDWLKMSRGKERVPLIGLTATPFRGHSESETARLAARFDHNRLDEIGDDPYGALQEMEVLAKVEHRLLAGSTVTLSPDELDSLQQTTRLPPSVLDRIGDDKGRNNAILESVLDLPEDYPVLLFAASVAHAELMASLLSIQGVPSRAISARTDRGSRQHYIEQFRRGEVRVLTNFGVLTEGFDAPAVRAVYVARPTYSPNVYQQMIGRGLRGPKNGGKPVCLIVNVEDNLAAYGEDLAFVAFEHLWERETDE